MRNINFLALCGRNNVVVYKIADCAHCGKLCFSHDNDLVFCYLDYISIVLFVFELCKSVLRFLAVCLVDKDLFCIRIGGSVRIIPVLSYGKVETELFLDRVFESRCLFCYLHLCVVVTNNSVAADVEKILGFLRCVVIVFWYVVTACKERERACKSNNECDRFAKNVDFFHDFSPFKISCKARVLRTVLWLCLQGCSLCLYSV